MYMSDEHNIATEKYQPDLKSYMYASSIVGTRKYQQDSYGCIETPVGCLAVVCDGMGGLEGGERASGLAGIFFMMRSSKQTSLSIISATKTDGRSAQDQLSLLSI